MLLKTYDNITAAVINNRLWICGNNTYILGGIKNKTFTEIYCDFDGSGIRNIKIIYCAIFVITNDGNLFFSGKLNNCRIIAKEFVQLIGVSNVYNVYGCSYNLIYVTNDNKLYRLLVTSIGNKISSKPKMIYLNEDVIKVSV